MSRPEPTRPLDNRLPVDRATAVARLTGIGKKIAYGAWYLAFAALSVQIAEHAFTFLSQRPTGPRDVFGLKFALQGIDVPLHFFGAGLALLLGILQASSWVRRRWPALHRIGGWLSAAAILVGGVSGLSMSFHAYGGWRSGLGFFLAGVLWMATAAYGIRCAVMGDYAAHRRWMLRCMAVTYAGVTLRLILPMSFVFKLPFESVYIFAAWACWSVNLMICELWLRWPAWRHQRRLLAVSRA
ncbi:DUF2306 domain-containing protein [Tahibacter amnicola]|uniref:DUF2306 domain-containing protein n=1 Tax=Tahibacter amnicola TaxID=2976241 RepID=A0ABY6BJT8_9GAMM|nr:DUF2306 domain-containing protein [Tahibacter amnicola]UXI70281.1 DUF2306 domain-containing protein [Tahibacter amnicola]